jgi:hypothetical protein
VGSHPELSLTLTPHRVAASLAFASTMGCECGARGWRFDRRGQGAVAVVVKIGLSSRSPKYSQNHLRRKPTQHLKMLSVCSVYHTTYLDKSLASCLGKVSEAKPLPRAHLVRLLFSYILRPGRRAHRLTWYGLCGIPSPSNAHVSGAVPPPQQRACRVGRVTEYARVRKIVLNRATSMLCPPAQKVCVWAVTPNSL